jgi:hypothetical protein
MRREIEADTLDYTIKLLNGIRNIKISSSLIITKVYLVEASVKFIKAVK